MTILKIKNAAVALALTLAALSSAPSALAEGDPERGAVVGRTCLGCHGIPGYRNAYPSFRVPKLGGQKGAYIKAALQAYRDGTRSHPTMHAQATTLSDRDIDDIVAWITQSGTASDDIDAASVGNLEAAKTCVACHGSAGVNVQPAPPVLSGQHRDYLEHTLKQYKEGVRVNAVMNSFAAGLSEEDMEQIAAFYASEDGLHTLGEDE